MRSLILALTAGATLLAAGAASAGERPLILNIKPRSWLDAGTQVQVGQYQSYVYDHSGLRDHARFGPRGGQVSGGNMRPGEGISFYTPQWWDVR